MISACREAVRKTLKENQGGQAHPGLVLQRGLETQENQGVAKDGFFESVIGSCKQLGDFYPSVFNRYENALNESGCEMCHLQVEGRLAIGLSTPSPLEIGLTLHHIYGVPYIPGSALKGLSAHYCKEVWGKADPGFENEYYQTIFGTCDDSGHICFYDAWLIPQSLSSRDLQVLNKDIINVHQSTYYTSKPKSKDDPANAQVEDFEMESPVPLNFLSIRGQFLFAVACDNPGTEGQKWATLALELMAEALKNWGIGAKTNSGYGRMTKV